MSFFVIEHVVLTSCLSVLTDAVTVCEAKDAFDLVECHVFLDLHHVSIEFR